MMVAFNLLLLLNVQIFGNDLPPLERIAFSSEGKMSAEPALGNPVKHAEMLDPQKNQNWRKPVPNAYRTKLGLQFHPVCVKLAQEKTGFSKEEVTSRLEAFMEKLTSRTLNCERLYPELKPYLREWIFQARRSVIACWKEENPLIAATNFQANVGLKKYGIDHEGRKGLGARVIRPNSKHGKTLIGAGPHLMQMLALNDPNGFHALMHELSHSSRMGSRQEHNTLFSMADPDDDASCGDAELLDRVEVINSLCQGINLYFSNGTEVQNAIAHRIERCGMEKGCKQIFNGKSNNLTMGMEWAQRPLHLSDSASEQLCRRIQGDDACIQKYNTSFWDTMKHDDEIQKISVKVEERLKGLISFKNHILKRGLLDHLPAFQQTLASHLKNHACAGNLVEKDRAGNLKLKITREKSYKFFGVGLSNLFPSHLRNWINQFGLLIQNKCGVNPKAFMDDLTRLAKKDFAENLEFILFLELGNQVLNLAQMNTEIHPGPAALNLQLFTSKDYDRALNQLLGKRLTQELREVLLEHYPHDSNFDCIAQGLRRHY